VQTLPSPPPSEIEFHRVVWVLYVVIGRNIGLEPMAQGKWESFRLATRIILDSWAGCVEFEVCGAGGAWNGAPEDSAVFMVFPIDPQWSELLVALAELATDYGQEAIAVAWGQSILVGAA